MATSKRSSNCKTGLGLCHPALAQLEHIDEVARRVYDHIESARVTPKLEPELWKEFGEALFNSNPGARPNRAHCRPSFGQIYMSMAALLSQRSTCARLKVGCVITSDDYRYVYSIGYNGNAQGLPNRCDSEKVGNCGCVHAEANAVINCNAPRSAEKIVFCTDLPCATCAKYLVNLGGVVAVHYQRDYRLQDGLKILRASSIVCTQFGA